MSGLFATNETRTLSALDVSMAIIEFDLDGTVLRANRNFYDVMGYAPAEIVGQKHRIFLNPEYSSSREYQTFWQGLRGGRFASDEFRRLAKGGREVYIQANYNPIFDRR